MGQVNTIRWDARPDLRAMRDLFRSCLSEVSSQGQAVVGHCSQSSKHRRDLNACLYCCAYVCFGVSVLYCPLILFWGSKLIVKYLCSLTSHRQCGRVCSLLDAQRRLDLLCDPLITPLFWHPNYPNDAFDPVWYVWDIGKSTSGCED
jgi:hypothetical protein